MALTLTKISGPVTVNGQAARNGQPVGSNDLVETGAGGSVQIFDNAANLTAANVAGNPTSLATNTPPTSTLLYYYYNTSYRYTLSSTGGNTGIRG